LQSIAYFFRFVKSFFAFSQKNVHKNIGAPACADLLY